VEYDSRELPPPQPGERVLNADEVSALSFPFLFAGQSPTPQELAAFMAATPEEKRLMQEDALGRLVKSGTVTPRKSASGGFCFVVGPVTPGRAGLGA
jgi:hypothetical protein